MLFGQLFVIVRSEPVPFVWSARFRVQSNAASNASVFLQKPQEVFWLGLICECVVQSAGPSTLSPDISLAANIDQNTHGLRTVTPFDALYFAERFGPKL